MLLSFAETVRIILKRENISVENLASRLDTTRQNLNQKLLQNNFKESDMKKIAAALGYDLVISLEKIEKN